MNDMPNDDELAKLLTKATALRDRRLALDDQIAACQADIQRVSDERAAHHESVKAALAEAQTILGISGASKAGKEPSTTEDERLANWKSPPSLRKAPPENQIFPEAHMPPDETLN